MNWLIFFFLCVNIKKDKIKIVLKTFKSKVVYMKIENSGYKRL